MPKIYLLELNLEEIKFKEFHFSISCNQTDLIKKAEFIEAKLKLLKNKEVDYESINKMMKKLDNPEIRAVFERLKDK